MWTAQQDNRARSPRGRYARRRAGVAVALVGACVGLAITVNATTGGAGARTLPTVLAGHRGRRSRSHTSAIARFLAGLERRVTHEAGNLQPGSNPSVLPGPILIADRDNNRLLLVDPRGRILWQFPNTATHATIPFGAPDDAFFSPSGNDILATQESRFTISEISPLSDRIVWHYGHPGVSGAAPGYLNNPDDAMLLSNGNVVSADIKNCRLLSISTMTTSLIHVFGETTPYCYHQPPARFGSPNGMFPMTNGDWLITEINGDWVDEMTPSGHIVWSTHPPGITYPSDTNEVRPGVFLTASYTKPGVVEEFNQAGTLLWRYAPTGTAALDEPSLALPLPNGDILVNDDWNDRVIVIDPHTNRIVWQYGVTGIGGSRPGYLHKPDGVDLAPPHSLAITHARTMRITAAP